MVRFTSNRERNLWLAAAIVVVTVLSTLGVAGLLAEELQNREMFDAVFVAGFALLLIAVASQGFQRWPSIAMVGITLGIAGVYLMVLARMGIPEERTHLFEYSVVGLLIYLALIERRGNGGSIRWPAATAIVTTATIGLIDELIQWVLPNRVFDIRDVAFNALAGTMAVLATALLVRVSGRPHKRVPPSGGTAEERQ